MSDYFRRLAVRSNLKLSGKSTRKTAQTVATANSATQARVQKLDGDDGIEMHEERDAPATVRPANTVPEHPRSSVTAAPSATMLKPADNTPAAPPAPRAEALPVIENVVSAPVDVVDAAVPGPLDEPTAVTEMPAKAADANVEIKPEVMTQDLHRYDPGLLPGEPDTPLSASPGEMAAQQTMGAVMDSKQAEVSDPTDRPSFPSDPVATVLHTQTDLVADEINFASTVSDALPDLAKDRGEARERSVIDQFVVDDRHANAPDIPSFAAVPAETVPAPQKHSVEIKIGKIDLQFHQAVGTRRPGAPKPPVKTAQAPANPGNNLSRYYLRSFTG